MKRDSAIFILRFVTGLIFLFAGASKLFSLGATTDSLNTIGIPFPSFMAIVLAVVETLAGLALIFGIFMKYAAPLLAFIMVVAVITVHLKNGINLENVGLQYSVLLIAVNVALMSAGPGAYSLENIFK